MPDTPQTIARPVPYAAEAKRQSAQTIAIIAGLIGFIMVVFGVLFGMAHVLA